MRQPTLEALFDTPPAACSDSGAADALEVYDLFCGAGGFSEGARAAGCRVAFACDSDPEALDTHARNHPQTTHVQCTLPAPLPLPTDGRPFHLHGSPPCTKFSSINARNRVTGDKDGAVNLVEWYIATALASAATSWSMEQVASRDVLEIVEGVRTRNPTRVAYAVVNFVRLGVPQNRKRVIAGSPALVGNLLRQAEQQPRRSVRDVVAVPRGTHVRSSISWIRKRRVGTRWTYLAASVNDFCHSIDGPSPTLCGQTSQKWVNPRKNDGWFNVLTPAEMAAIQTFPSTYQLPHKKSVATKQIVNAVPPLVAELMLRDAATGRLGAAR
jgi:DNA (cytosine-5)-methyltransferase 1